MWAEYAGDAAAGKNGKVQKKHWRRTPQQPLLIYKRDNRWQGQTNNYVDGGYNGGRNEIKCLLEVYGKSSNRGDP